MIIRTDAIVLRSINYGETSQIVTLFTREHGKVTVMAKGARLTKSRFGASLQPMAYTQVIYYHKPTRELQTLSESAYVEPFLRIQRDLEKITLGLRLVELTGALMQREDAQPAVFSLLLEALRRLDRAEARSANVLPYFQLRLATALGFAPSVVRAAVEALPEEGGLLALESGAVEPAGGSMPEAARRASRAALRAYAIFARADLDAVMRMRLRPALRREVQSLVEDYLRYHLQEALPSKSSAVISRLFSGPPPE